MAAAAANDLSSYLYLEREYGKLASVVSTIQDFEKSETALCEEITGVLSDLTGQQMLEARNIIEDLRVASKDVRDMLEPLNKRLRSNSSLEGLTGNGSWIAWMNELHFTISSLQQYKKTLLKVQSRQEILLSHCNSSHRPNQMQTPAVVLPELDLPTAISRYRGLLGAQQVRISQLEELTLELERHCVTLGQCFDRLRLLQDARASTVTAQIALLGIDSQQPEFRTAVSGVQQVLVQVRKLEQDGTAACSEVASVLLRKRASLDEADGTRVQDSLRSLERAAGRLQNYTVPTLFSINGGGPIGANEELVQRLDTAIGSVRNYRTRLQEASATLEPMLTRYEPLLPRGPQLLSEASAIVDHEEDPSWKAAQGVEYYRGKLRCHESTCSQLGDYISELNSLQEKITAGHMKRMCSYN